MNIRIKKLHPDAQIPSIAHEGDAGFDLFATESVTLNPGARLRLSHLGQKWHLT
jgi:dUTP pyrophosphatase